MNKMFAEIFPEKEKLINIRLNGVEEICKNSKAIKLKKIKSIDWLKVSQDSRTYLEIGKELGINKKTVRLNLKRRGLTKKRIITKNSRNVIHYCVVCNRQISRGSEKCISCATKGKIGWRRGLKFPLEKSMRWKGGRVVHKNGYIEVYSPTHPYKNKNGYVSEHRIVVEGFIKRNLTPNEVIHHIDENKHNNKIENLMIFPSHQEHAKFHIKLKRLGFTRQILRQIENRWDEYLRNANEVPWVKSR